MADVNSTTPYELLVRWKEETGEYSGAQMTYWRKRVIDDEVIMNRANSPIAVNLGDLPAEINNLNQTTITALAAVQTALDAKTTEAETLTGELSSLNSQVTSFATQITQQQTAIASRDGQIADLNAQIASLQEQLNNPAE